MRARSPVHTGNVKTPQRNSVIQVCTVKSHCRTQAENDGTDRELRLARLQREAQEHSQVRDDSRPHWSEQKPHLLSATLHLIFKLPSKNQLNPFTNITNNKKLAQTDLLSVQITKRHHFKSTEVKMLVQ